MAKDVTINITANASGAVNDLNNTTGGGTSSPSTPPGGSTGQNPPIQPQNPPVPPISPGGNSPAIPAYDRMAQDIRREMLSRGALMVPGSSNFNQLMAAVQQQQRTAAYQQIDDRYTQGVTQTQQELENKRKTELDRLEQERQDKLSKAVTPNAAQRINDQYDRRIERLNDSIEIEKATAFTQLGQERDNDKAKVEQDLARIAAELVQELRQGNPNSYLGRLRQQYSEATWRRDNAETEAEARAASTEAAEIQKQISRGSSPRNYLGVLSTSASLASTGIGAISTAVDMQRQNTFAKIATINAAANGDIFGAMEQDIERGRNQATSTGSIIGMIAGAVIGGALAPFTGGASLAMGIGLGAGIGGGVGALGARTYYNATTVEDETQAKLGQLWASNERRIQQFNELALVTQGIHNNSGNLGAEREDWIYALLADNSFEQSGIAPAHLGYTSAQFSEIMANRIKQRGFMSQDEILKSNLAGYYLKQVALERVYNMSDGSLAQYGAYDRYNSVGGHQNDANQDMANLVASLNARGVKGMSGGQTLRANEFLNYQTQLMEMQKGWMDAPNSNYATRLLLAAQNAFGNNLDSRAITEIGQIENTVTHPKEDYSKALLYDVIQDVMPETKGNLLAIRQAQYSDDPNVRMKIQQAMAKRIQEVYGGIDTTSGYLAASHYYGIEDPERLRKIINQYERGLPQVTEGSVERDVEKINGYTPDVSYEMLKYQDRTVLDISDKLSDISDILTGLPSKFNSKIDELLEELRD